MLGYKHTKQAIAKIQARFLNKNNHPMFGSEATHSEVSKHLISKPGELNPMFGSEATHSEVLKHSMSIKKSSFARPLGLYDENNNFIDKYSDQVELANKFGEHKTTISKYIKTGKLFKEKFYFRKINK